MFIFQRIDLWDIVCTMIKLEQPSNEFLEKYYEELGISKKSLVTDVSTLRLWLKKQPHLSHIADKIGNNALNN